MQKINTPRPLHFFAVLLVLLLCLAGCSGGGFADSHTYAQSLYDSRVATVEDSAGLNCLFSQLGIESRMGPFTTELERKEDGSNALVLKFQQVPEDTDVFKDQFEYYSVLLLALVDNCGQVRLTYPSVDGADSSSMDWNVQQVNDHLDVNLDSSSRSADGIASLLDAIRSAHSDSANFAAFYEDT